MLVPAEAYSHCDSVGKVFQPGEYFLPPECSVVQERSAHHHRIPARPGARITMPVTGGGIKITRYPRHHRLILSLRDLYFPGKSVG